MVSKFIAVLAVAAMIVTALGIVAGIMAFIILCSVELTTTAPHNHLGQHAIAVLAVSTLVTMAGTFLLGYASTTAKNLGRSDSEAG